MPCARSATPCCSHNPRTSSTVKQATLYIISSAFTSSSRIELHSPVAACAYPRPVPYSHDLAFAISPSIMPDPPSDERAGLHYCDCPNCMEKGEHWWSRATLYRHQKQFGTVSQTRHSEVPASNQTSRKRAHNNDMPSTRRTRARQSEDGTASRARDSEAANRGADQDIPPLNGIGPEHENSGMDEVSAYSTLSIRS